MKRLALWLSVGTFLLIAACTGGMFVYVASTTNDVAEVAEGFFTLLEQRKFDEAYAQTSALYQAWQNPASMERLFDRAGIADLKLVHWRDRTIERTHDADMRAVMLNGFGDEIPLIVRMAKEDNKWKVLQVADTLRAHVGPGMWFQVIPSKKELVELVNNDIRAFADAQASKDFLSFYWGHMSVKFQIEQPEWILDVAFKHLLKDDIDLSGVNNAEPSFDMRIPDTSDSLDTEAGGLGPSSSGTAVDFQGAFHGLALIEVFQREERAAAEASGGGIVQETDVLIVSGFYDIKPAPVPFLFRYVYQHPEWKLYRVFVDEPNLQDFSLGHCLRWLLQQEDKSPSRCFDLEDSRTPQEKLEASR